MLRLSRNIVPGYLIARLLNSSFLFSRKGDGWEEDAAPAIERCKKDTENTGVDLQLNQEIWSGDQAGGKRGTLQLHGKRRRAANLNKTRPVLSHLTVSGEPFP
jgi:hypothetical protein